MKMQCGRIVGFVDDGVVLCTLDADHDGHCPKPAIATKERCDYIIDSEERRRFGILPMMCNRRVTRPNNKCGFHWHSPNDRRLNRPPVKP